MRGLFLLLLCLLMLPVVPHAAAERMEKDELVVGMPIMPVHFNPAAFSGTFTASVGAQLFAGLTRLDRDGNAIPYLAQSWDVAPDGLSVLFHLRPGAVFHDGTPITAADVAFSLLQCRELHPFRPMLAPMRDVETPDSLTVRVRLHHPYPALPKVLTPSLVPIMPRHVYGQGAPLPRHPANVAVVGSGPFKLERVEQGKAIRLVRNDRFFLPNRPRLQRLTFRIFDDHFEIIYAAEQGDVDIYAGTMARSFRELLAQEGRRQWKEQPAAYLYSYLMLQYNLKKTPFSFPEVRKALALAFDRKKFSRICRENIYPMYGPFPLNNPYAISQPQPFDPAQANALLDAAGYPRKADGTRFTIHLYCAPGWNPMNKEMISFIQHEFSTLLGIIVINHRIENFHEFCDIIASGNFDMTLDSLFFWQDPAIGFHRLYASENKDRNLIFTNNSGYADKELDSLFAMAMQHDSKMRKKIYGDIQRKIAHDNPGLWIAYHDLTIILSPRVAHADSLVQGLLSPLDEVAVERIDAVH